MNRVATAGQGTERHDPAETKIGQENKLFVGMKQDIDVGQQISIQAGMKITLQAGTGTVTLDPSGVTIQGLLVCINWRSLGACGK